MERTGGISITELVVALLILAVAAAMSGPQTAL
jgi:type II secretory pathway pseudopilin PulG